VICKLGVVAATLLFGVVNANAVVYTTSGVSPDGAVSAEADVTYNAATHMLSVVLTNLTPNQHSSGQSLTGFYFDVGSIASTGAFTQAGNEVTLDSPAGLVPTGNAPSHWAGGLSDPNSIAITALSGSQPDDEILGPQPLNMNNGAEAHNPFIFGPATFTLFLNSPVGPVTNVEFGFGTGTFRLDGTAPPGTPDLFSSSVPEPSTWAMMMLGFAGVGFMAYRRKRQAGAFRLA
jgi:hypothetical protein